MLAAELMINGVVYQYQHRYLKDDCLWECTYVDLQGNMAEATFGHLVSYDESLGRAKKELETLVIDSQLQYDVDNEVVLWKNLDAERQRKIIVLAKKIKEEETSEWHSEGEDFRNWRERMYAHTGIRFRKSQYDNM